MLIQALTAADPGGGVTEAGIIVGLSGFDSSSSARSFSSSGRGGGGGGARLGHWPISAFSKDTGWEKSERLKGGRSMRFKNTDTATDTLNYRKTFFLKPPSRLDEIFASLVG